MNIDKPASLGKVTGQKPPSTQDQSQLSKFPATEHHSKAASQQNIHSSPMACIASSSCISVPHNPPGTVATSLQVPSTVTVTRSIPVSDANNTINMPSCNMNSLPVTVPQKENFKKRSRPTDTIAREQQMFSFTKPVVTSHMMNHANTTTSVTSGSFQPSADDGTNSAQTQEHETGLALTKEQIADVIDTTLPTNFSFSLPVAKLPRQKLSVSNKKARKTPGLPLPHPVSKISGTSFNIPASDRVIARKPVPPSCSDSVGSGSAKSGRTARTTDSMKSPSSGRWTRDEHEAFLEGLKIYGREWKKVAQRIPTRTSAQIRSHAQKYFAKLARDERQQAASLSSQASVAMSATAGLGASTSAISISAPSMGEIRREYSPSVVERIQKILDDPKGAEREVEETLDRLKRRYNELQRKLELQEQRRIAAQQQQQQYHYNQQKSQAQEDQFISFPFSNSTHMKDDSNMITQFKFSDQPQTIVESCNSQGTMKMSPPRPRPCANLPPTSSLQSRPPVTITSESLALHSKELIALTVLGGELYRSASQENLRKAADNAETSQPGEGTQCQQSSNKYETDSNNDGSPVHKTN